MIMVLDTVTLGQPGAPGRRRCPLWCGLWEVTFVGRVRCAPHGSGRGAPVPVARFCPCALASAMAGSRREPAAPRRPRPLTLAGRLPPPSPLVFSLVMGAKAGDCARLGRTSRADHPGRRPETHHDRQPAARRQTPSQE